MGEDDDQSTASNTSSTTKSSGVASDSTAETKQAKTEAPVVKEEPKIEYEYVSVHTLNEDLKANAFNASDKYKGNYYAVSGRLGAIDASGKYIAIYDEYDEWDFIGCRCDINSPEVLETVKKLSVDSVITVNGRIKDVGEIMGYSMDIDSISY